MIGGIGCTALTERRRLRESLPCEAAPSCTQSGANEPESVEERLSWVGTTLLFTALYATL